ncbi:IS66 family transposase [Alteromonas confluentis]|uniref:Transposase n=1 Tax=Alteromonas confluentis TaxID=1656094 RepID=A0A1E7Z6W4_9ALTE|nr:IS66 family transposase [Alteromonas confluentis]OFC69250.1 transposase [Alteromonas confluentis]OFC69613.1 transposase [Alteromonas confluentis]OFC69937.1 transposase [Alteromonas confluentis]OFC70039.1 transposase [Alteromonas confluentis]OFC70669.1 transposase [Alteromonas confluentis]
MNEEDYQRRIAELEQQLRELNNRYQYLEEQFRIAQQKQFGKSTEGHPGQGELFNEAEELTADVETPEQETISYTRNKPKRKPLPEDLPREVIVHDIPDEDKVCGCCAGTLHCIGEDKSEKLQFIPAQVKVIEHVRPKYACRTCEKEGISNTVKQAPVPHSVIPKGYATPSLLSQIITSKYQYGLPLYRQEAMFKQHGIELSRKTMADWIIRCAELFKPLYDQLHQHLLKQPVIQADETTLKVVDSDKATSYMWLYATGADSPQATITGSSTPNIVLYDYHNSRAGRCAVDFLDGYSGYLQVDGYQGYEQTQATLVGCWAHARRKFMEAKKGAGSKGSGKADWALNHIQKLYRVETQLKEETAATRYAQRQEKSLPLLNQFEAWLIKSAQQVLPKTKLGEAIQYCLNQWHKLVRYTLDGQLTIDNNRAERAIKPFVIGRKNWLFSQTATGANASAILYSIIETAKANDLNAFDYVMACLEQLSKPETGIEQHLPWQFAKR